MPEDLCVYEAHVPSSVCLVLWAGEVVLYVLAEIVTPGLYFVCVYGGKWMLKQQALWSDLLP